MGTGAGMGEVGEIRVSHDRQAARDFPFGSHEEAALILHGCVVAGTPGEERRVAIAIITLGGKQ